MKFGDKLVGLRKKNGLSQEELAEKLGVSRQSVSKWESNNAYPETDKIVQICNLFDCSMDDLINDQITDLKQIDRKEKNNLAKSVDSFFDYISKTINMFSDMTFGSGFKCVLKMGLLALGLFLLGLFVVGVTSSVIGRLFGFLNHGYVIETIIHSVLGTIWLVIAIIVLFYTFKIRYLDYYVKAKEEKQENINPENKEKIELKPTEKIIIRDSNDKSYSFLSGLAKVVKFFIKLMLIFFMMGIIPGVIGLGVILFLSLIHITVSSLFVGIFISALAAIISGLVILTVFIDFIFNKKSKYRFLLILFLLSIVFFGVGIGITTYSFKNFKIKDAKSLINDKSVIDVKYSDNLVIISSGLGDVNYEFDESLGDNIKVEVKYNNKINMVETANEDYYGADTLIIYRGTKDFHMKDIYDIVIKDIKNNTLREYDNTFVITIKSSKATIDKVLANTSKVYRYNQTKIDNGYKLDSIQHRINEYNACDSEVRYNAFSNELKSSEGCNCEKIERDSSVEINCE